MLAIACLSALPASAGSQSDEHAIVFASTHALNFWAEDIFVVDIRGRRTNLTRTAGVREYDPAWAPDGARLVFSRQGLTGRAELFISHRDGSNLRQLTSDPAEESEPAWSPDGSRLAFIRKRVTTSELRVIELDGGGERILAESTYENVRPMWSPDGRLILFSRHPDIYVVGLDGSPPRRVATGGSGRVYPLGWLSNNRIAYVRELGEGVLYAVGIDGSGVRRLANPCRSASPLWSRNRSRVGCVGDGKSARDVEGVIEPTTAVFRTGGGRPLARVTLHPRNQQVSFRGIALSPGGDRLAYSLSTDERDSDIWTAREDGSAAKQLTGTAHEDHDPALSPDGRRVVFVRDHRYQERTGVGHLMLLDVASRRTRPLRGRLAGSAPEWAPDGKRIVFARGDYMYVIDAKARKLRRLVRGGEPTWSPTGQQLAFVRRSGLWIHHLSQRRTRKLVALPASGYVSARDPAWSPDGSALVFSTGSTVRIVDVNSGVARILVRDEANPLSSPTWSASGSTIVYAAGWQNDIPYPHHVPDAHFLQLWSVSTAGENRRPIVRGSGFHFDPDSRR